MVAPVRNVSAVLEQFGAIEGVEPIFSWSPSNLLDGVLVVAPRIPSELNNVETTVAIGCGRLEYVFKRYDGKQYLSLTLSGQKSVDLSCELKEYDAVSLTLGQGKR